MIRILVVEDEPPILRGICSKITKSYEHCDIVHCASNGQEALDYLKEHTVDVVFTDINMPLINGLELLEYISIHYPSIYTIILSGYQDFHYAQKAVKLGAYDYLLKPLDLSSTQALLQKLSKKIHTKKLTQIFQGDYFGDTATPLILVPPIHFMSICAGPFPIKGVPPHLNHCTYWDDISIESLLDKLGLSSSDYCIINSIYSTEKLIIFTQLSSARIQLLAEQLYSHLCTYSLPITLTTSEPFEDSRALYENYIAFTMKLSRIIVFGQSSLVSLSKKITYKDYFLPSSIEHKLIHALEKKNFSLFKQELQTLYKELETLNLSQSTVDVLLNHIALLCKKSHFIDISLYEIKSKIYEFILQYSNYKELFDIFIRTLIENQSPQIAHAVQDKAYLMDQIDHFITAHITEPITNQTLSEHFGLVPSYISKLFKTHKGISPSEYILMLRIDKAKELLTQDINLLAKDIASIVGYSDPLYFSRVFKKVTGVYPSEYRKNELDL
ncbi:MAG: response regulator transcription factor [Cellulosilyticaceae bacterium]